MGIAVRLFLRMQIIITVIVRESRFLLEVVFVSEWRSIDIPVKKWSSAQQWMLLYPTMLPRLKETRGVSALYVPLVFTYCWVCCMLCYDKCGNTRLLLNGMHVEITGICYELLWSELVNIGGRCWSAEERVWCGDDSMDWKEVYGWMVRFNVQRMHFEGHGLLSVEDEEQINWGGQNSV
jgi:hypothetical protein